MPCYTATTHQRALIWEAYEAQRPRQGVDFEEFIEKQANEHNLTVPLVRRILAQQAGVLMQEISGRLKTQAQQIGDILGADMVRALETFREGMSATNKRPFLDSSGRPKLDDEGRVIFIETEAWDARLSAARSVVEIYGARAPQQIEIEQKTTIVDLTNEDAITEARRLQSSIATLAEAIARASQRTPQIAGSGGAIEGATGDSGRLLLDDGMHADARRAGPAEPVQAIPVSPVPPAAPGGAR